MLSRSGPFWARFHYEKYKSTLIPVPELADDLECPGNIRNSDRHAYQASVVLRKCPKPRQAGLSGIFGVLETPETPTGTLIRRLGCTGNVRNPNRHAYQAFWVPLTRPKPRQARLSDASRRILGASAVVLEVSETPAGTLIRRFAFPLGCSSGSF